MLARPSPQSLITSRIRRAVVNSPDGAINSSDMLSSVNSTVLRSLAPAAPGRRAAEQHFVGRRAGLDIVQHDDDMIEPGNHGNSPRGVVQAAYAVQTSVRRRPTSRQFPSGAPTPPSPASGRGSERTTLVAGNDRFHGIDLLDRECDRRGASRPRPPEHLRPIPHPPPHQSVARFRMSGNHQHVLAFFRRERGLRSCPAPLAPSATRTWPRRQGRCGPGSME